MNELKTFEDWVKLIQVGCPEIREPPYEGIPAPLPRCNLTDNACRFDICPKRERNKKRSDKT